jgi:hypothetical protein
VLSALALTLILMWRKLTGRRLDIGRVDDVDPRYFG